MPFRRTGEKLVAYHEGKQGEYNTCVRVSAQPSHH